jgi:homoserine dehydrogenase
LILQPAVDSDGSRDETNETETGNPVMTVRVGVLGAGTVGGALVARLLTDRDAIRLKSGVDLEVRRVAVRDIDKPRPFDLKPERLTDDPMSVVTDPTVDVIVEVMGGLDPAGELILAAVRAGKPVVTANKELIATRGEEITEAAKRAGVSVMYEAAVGGGIPVIRPLAESLAGEDIDTVSGIVNGTTNYILSAMAQEGTGYEDALAEAQRLGYAETDPGDDVSGRDAAFKTSILASLAFGERVAPWEVELEGIENVTSEDIADATSRGEVIKLIGSAQRGIDGKVEARVAPTRLPSDHPLAGVNGVTNAIFIEGPSVGRLLFTGPGAGGEPTASAMLGDLIQVASRGRGPRQRSPHDGSTRRQVLHR